MKDGRTSKVMDMHAGPLNFFNRARLVGPDQAQHWPAALALADPQSARTGPLIVCYPQLALLAPRSNALLVRAMIRQARNWPANLGLLSVPKGGVCVCVCVWCVVCVRGVCLAVCEIRWPGWPALKTSLRAGSFAGQGLRWMLTRKR